MMLYMHMPMFGTPHIDSKPIECPHCPRGKESGENNWVDIDLTECDPGDQLTCKKCGNTVYINWGLVEPDHLSSWLNSEYCPHRICKLKFAELCKEKGWNKNLDGK